MTEDNRLSDEMNANTDSFTGGEATNPMNNVSDDSSVELLDADQSVDSLEPTVPVADALDQTVNSDEAPVVSQEVAPAVDSFMESNLPENVGEEFHAEVDQNVAPVGVALPEQDPAVTEPVSDTSYSAMNHSDDASFTQTNHSVSDSWFADQTNVVDGSNSSQDEKRDTTYDRNLSSPRYVGYKSRLVKYVIISFIALAMLVLAVITYFSINITSSYREKSSINYQVCLSENEYYSTSCIGENVEYLTAISDTIKIDYNYSAVYEQQAARTFKYYVKTNLLVKTISEPEKELLSKEKEITDVKEVKSEGIVINTIESVDIPFQEYNGYAQKYKNDFSILSNCDLIVSLVERDEGKDRVISSVTIPLTKSTYNITKNELKEHVMTYEVPALKAKRDMVLIAVAVAIVINIIVWIKLIRFLSATTVHDSEYEKKLKKILNTYDRVIVTLNDRKRIDFNQQIYPVDSFTELLDVRDTIDKPILYYKVNSIKTEFYVQDVDKIYKYTMKEADFDKQDQGDV